MAQRLVRRLCVACTQGDDPSPALLQRWSALAVRLVDPVLGDIASRWRRAVGCPVCQQTGYRGRVGVYELAQITSEIRHLIADNGAPAALQQLADAAGRRSLVEDGLIKARQGETSFDEVLRAAGGIQAD